MDFQDHRISLYFKSLKLNRQFAPKINPTLTVSTLESVITVAKTMQHQVTFVALYSFCFFSFLRLSNLLPHTPNTFDITRHLARGDIIFTSFGAIVIIKWSKTMQNRKDTCTIAIPSLGRSEICRVTALKTMFTCLPGTDNDLLFRICKKETILPLTDSTARKHLKQISSCSKYNPLSHFMLLGGLLPRGLSSMVSHLNIYRPTECEKVMAYGHIYALLPPPLLRLLRLLGNIYSDSLAPWESHTCPIRL